MAPAPKFMSAGFFTFTGETAYLAHALPNESQTGFPMTKVLLRRAALLRLPQIVGDRHDKNK